MNRTEVESKPFIDRSVDIAESTRNVMPYRSFEQSRSQGEGAGTETSVNDQPKTSEWV